MRWNTPTWLLDQGGGRRHTSARRLDADRDADLLIVGGGYTGMWTAWHARRLAPDARIVLLESEPVCGRGPSGRNGGFVEGLWTTLASMRARWGDAPALAVAHAAEEAVRADRAASARAEGVDAWFRRGGYLRGVDDARPRRHRPRRARRLPGARRPRQAARGRRRRRSAARCASPEFRAGVMEPGAATVQPARLALGDPAAADRRGRRDLRVLAGPPLPRGRRRGRGDDRHRRPRPRPARRPRDRRRRESAARSAAASPSPPRTS